MKTKMKNFMIVFVVDGKQSALFADTYIEAQDIKIDIECGLGGYSEIYERRLSEYPPAREYFFLES